MIAVSASTVSAISGRVRMARRIERGDESVCRFILKQSEAYLRHAPTLEGPDRNIWRDSVSSRRPFADHHPYLRCDWWHAPDPPALGHGPRHWLGLPVIAQRPARCDNRFDIDDPVSLIAPDAAVGIAMLARMR